MRLDLHYKTKQTKKLSCKELKGNWKHSCSLHTQIPDTAHSPSTEFSLVKYRLPQLLQFLFLPYFSF